MSRLGAAPLVLAMLVSGCTAAAPSASPQPAALPASAITPDQRVVAYPNGRWLLYGEGTAAAPYTWVWIPAGATPPPAAAPAR